jgi:uncharacterized protein
MLIVDFLYILEMKFEWDPDKNRRNYRKHGVAFEEATTVWTDTSALIVADPTHSVGEEREWMIGVSEWESLMVVVFTQRGDRVRIISARLANQREREGYVGQLG